ncbi:endo-beta-1 [Colletotrichum sojae]|uniref:Endo-beta-1 n=1 Tax=Colletotrichum sojae TaxID=2175907 RepID=A0A8H6JTL4_9PEZI|nr:endo-beta-1 [Colletotrichum sojae]
MRRLMSISGLTALLVAVLSPASASESAADGQRLPLLLSVIDQNIVDSKNATVALIGVNWAGHERTMLPEGLQHQPIAAIVSKVAEVGFNSVRLTFATEMVDDVVDRGGDVTLKTTLERALGAENGTKVLQQIVKNNPSFNENTKRLEVWDAVAAELARQNVFLHLDNHLSKAGWCCPIDDGNGWFGDTFFNTSNWVRSLSFMAEHGKANWKSFSSIGLRNEIREPAALPFAQTLEPRNWTTWKTRMVQAANAVHAANPEVLVFFGGRLLDYDISAPAQGSAVGEPGFNFSLAELPFRNKFVFEQHQYNQIEIVRPGDDCASYVSFLDGLEGNLTVRSAAGSNRAPLVMSEWGHDQRDEKGVFKQSFRRCLVDYMVDRKIGWMVWVLGGSYYTREGVADYDEPFGLLDHTWSSFRGTDSIKQMQADMKRTYAAFNQTLPSTAKDLTVVSSGGSSWSASIATVLISSVLAMI